MADPCGTRCEEQPDADTARIQREAVSPEGSRKRSCYLCTTPCKLADPIGEQDYAADAGRLHAQSCGKSLDSTLADTNHPRSQRWVRGRQDSGRENQHRYAGCDGATNIERAGPTNGFWRNADWIWCRDGKWRAVEPCTFPLAYGIANRVGRLRAYGNAIVAQAAEIMITAYMEWRENKEKAK